MTAALGALGPVALVILLGLLLRRGAFLDAAGWGAVERLVYYVLFPALLFVELARAELGALPAGALTAAILVTQGALFAAALLLGRAARLPGPAVASLVQGVVRWNSYVALALAPLLFGPAAGPVAALAVGVVTPTANLLSVAALAGLGREGGAGGAGGFARAIATNPIILACAAGALWSAAGPDLPRAAGDALAILGRSGLALGLLLAGAGLSPGPLRANGRLLLAAVLGRLLLGPALAAGLGLGLGLEGAALGTLTLAFAVPTSPASVTLARLMGGDAGLMAGIVALQTVAAAATLPFVLGLLPTAP